MMYTFLKPRLSELSASQAVLSRDSLPLDLVPCQRSSRKPQGPRLGLRGLQFKELVVGWGMDGAGGRPLP